MPYATPLSPVPSSSSTMTFAATNGTRSAHRRTRSAFSDESGPGAFVSLGSLPRRRPTPSSSTKKAVFHFSEDDDSPQEQDSPEASTASPPNGEGAYAPTNSLRLSIQSGRFSPSVNPPSHIEIPRVSVNAPDAVPFPASSPSTERLSFLPPSPPHTNSLPRTPSTPIILSNGKPLKSSLKSSSSSPNVAAEFSTNTTVSQRKHHYRVQSAPSTPRVHFAEKDAGLESVRLFKATGKPASVSKPSGEETETETEAESYPFPLLSSSSALFAPSSLSLAGSSGMAHHHNQLAHEIDTSTGVTSAIPNPSPSPAANVFLETITLPRTQPPTLRGTVLVRNLAFEKNVAVRFTLDDWQTTSEVLCKHVVSLPGLPPPFPRSLNARPKTMGDVAASIANGESLGGEGDSNNAGPAWDRFSFTIRLEDYETKLAERTLFIVARYICPAGEFWDNNDASNYRVGFRRASSSPLPTPMGTPARMNTALFPVSAGAASAVTSQQRTFSAPSSLKCTPVTGSAPSVNRATADRRNVAPAVVTEEPEKTPIEKDVEVVSPLPVPAPLVRRHSTPQSLAVAPNLPHFPSPPPSMFNTIPQSSAKNPAAKYLSRRLSLSNYVAPSPVVPSTDESVKDGSAPLVTPPTTPPKETRLRGLPTPAGSSSTKLSPLVIIGGMPATAPPPPLSATSVSLPSSSSSSSSPSSSRSSSHSDLYPLNIGNASFVPNGTNADDVSLPFSPTSRSHGGFKMSSLGAQLALSQLASPPVSNEGSEASTPSSSGRNSPTGREKEADPTGIKRKGSPTRLELPSLEGAFREDMKKSSPVDDDDLTPTATDNQPSPVQLPSPTSSKTDSSSDSYAAFIRQWCFAQSAPPTPGVIATSEASPSSTSGAVTPSAVPLSSLQTGPNGFGLGMLAGGVAYATGPAPRRQQPWPGEQQSLGYGFPGFGLGAIAHANKRPHEGAMVGAQMH